MARRSIYPPIRVGDRSARWEVIGVAESRRRPSGNLIRYWRCRCTCGKEKEIADYHLNSGATKSCGCLSGEVTALRNTKTRKWNGSSRSLEYHTWQGMHHRCKRPSSPVYRYYGGRGITVCPEWDNFDKFLQDMGPIPGPDFSLDRIDVNEGYNPSNCRWATWWEQQSNRRDNIYVEVDGERLCASEAARRLGMKPKTLQARLRDGWSAQDALTHPLGKRRFYRKPTT